MSPLRHRMIEDMQVRNLSSYTQRNYLYAIARLARHFAVSPADLGPEELRAYLTHLVERESNRNRGRLVAWVGEGG